MNLVSSIVNFDKQHYCILLISSMTLLIAIVNILHDLNTTEVQINKTDIT